MKYDIYTDGACSVNPGRGGWAFLVLENDVIINTCSDYEKMTTNQRMELTAAYMACRYCIKALQSEDDFVADEFNIYSDSAYLINCMNQRWYENWQRNDWHNSKKLPVANRDLWELLIPYFEDSRFNFIKVEGHSNNKYNNYVDQLAVSARSEI